MTDLPEDEARPQYAQLCESSVEVFLPREYSVADSARWLDTVSNYLDDKAYEVAGHKIAPSLTSAAPCAALRVYFVPKKGELRQRSHTITLLQQELKTEYTTAVYARFARGYAFDEVVGSQVRLASALGTTSRIDPREYLDWLLERRIEHHVTNDIVCFTLPAGCNPEIWQHSLANLFGAFVLKEGTDWH